MKGPLFFYYSLSNFFTNHKDFVKSRSFRQLRNVYDSSNFTDCKGALTNKEMFDGVSSRYRSYAGVLLDPHAIARPCGLTAKAFFNDTYELYQLQADGTLGSQVPINQTGIANDYDLEYMFKSAENSTLFDWIDVTDGMHYLHRALRRLDANGDFPEF